MQNSMPNEKSFMIPIPVETMEEAGLKDVRAIQIHTDGSRIIIERMDTSNFVCDEICMD